MAIDRDVDELVCRSVALVIFYRHVEKRRPDTRARVVEIREVADLARKSGIADHAILSRVDAELSHRFDDATRRRLFGRFAADYHRPADLVSTSSLQ